MINISKVKTGRKYWWALNVLGPEEDAEVCRTRTTTTTSLCYPSVLAELRADRCLTSSPRFLAEIQAVRGGLAQNLRRSCWCTLNTNIDKWIAWDCLSNPLPHSPPPCSLIRWRWSGLLTHSVFESLFVALTKNKQKNKVPGGTFPKREQGPAGKKTLPVKKNHLPSRRAVRSPALTNIDEVSLFFKNKPLLSVSALVVTAFYRWSPKGEV